MPTVFPEWVARCVDHGWDDRYDTEAQALQGMKDHWSAHHEDEPFPFEAGGKGQ